MSDETPDPTPAGAQDQLENALELKETEGLSQGQIVRRRFFRHRGAVTGLVALVIIVLLGFTSIGFGPVPGWWDKVPISRYPLANAGGAPTLSMPTWLGGDGFAIGDHPFGQDELGRDSFAMTMQGVQTSIVVMVLLGLVATTIGLVVGAVSGFYRGRADQILMRLTDFIIILPALVIGAVLGKQFGTADPIPLALVLGLVVWPGLARLVRSEFFSLREREFVDAARVAGASNSRIIFKHMIPNAMGVIIVNTTLLLSTAILLETSLSYLGFGIKFPNVSLGWMISEYQSAFSTRPWLFWWPGLFIVAIALAVNFLGDGLRDAFDPRQKRIPSERKMARAARRQQTAQAGQAS